MRILVASLGFSYHHVMAAANRCGPNKIVLVTVDRENERTKNAVEEVRLYARRVGAALEEASLNPEDFWKCVGDAAELFSERGGEYCLDIGGGVRALSLCLYTAALLAVRLWNTKIEAVYTMAEHAERIVQIDLMPILYVNELTRSNANARRRILEELAKGPLEDLGRYDKKILKEFTKHGLLNNDKLTEAGKTLLKYIQRRT